MERIPLDNTEFEGRNDAYLLDGERPTLVDTGLAVPAVEAQLRAGLAARGVDVADLEQILLTHWHADHAGLAGAFQAESGATVRVHPDDGGLAARDPDVFAELSATRDDRLTEWGMPDGPRTALEEFLAAAEDEEGEPADVTPLEDGESILAGDETLTAWHTPGHTLGHTSYRRPDGSVLSGDALLPTYTPNVGGADLRVDGPLGAYLSTLAGFVDGDFVRAHPGHRDPIEDPAARARTILEHHRTRSRRVLEVLAERAPADAWTVSAALFGDLEGIHILHGPGEADAHLDHLARHGMVERTADGYVLADGHADRDLDGLFPD